MCAKTSEQLEAKYLECQSAIEMRSDTGFRHKENKGGEVDGEALKGVNVERLGRAYGKKTDCHSFV